MLQITWACGVADRVILNQFVVYFIPLGILSVLVYITSKRFFGYLLEKMPNVQKKSLLSKVLVATFTGWFIFLGIVYIGLFLIAWPACL